MDKQILELHKDTHTHTKINVVQDSTLINQQIDYQQLNLEPPRENCV